MGSGSTRALSESLGSPGIARPGRETISIEFNLVRHTLSLTAILSDNPGAMATTADKKVEPLLSAVPGKSVPPWSVLGCLQSGPVGETLDSNVAVLCRSCPHPWNLERRRWFVSRSKKRFR